MNFIKYCKPLKPFLHLSRRTYATVAAGDFPNATKQGKSIFLDAQSTTTIDPRVLDAMLPYFTQYYGNPHSRTHAYGWETMEAVEKAREQVADLIHADPKEIIFTSGATESNNLAIKGIANFYQKKKKHIITTVTEHKCVLESCRQLSNQGFEVTYMPVKPSGLIDVNALAAAMRPDTALVSVMAVNNEIGVTQPLAEIGKVCREKGVFLHTDAAQAVGKIPMDVEAMNIDLMSISAHKLYGPKGIGALYLRRRPKVRIEPLISGGGQERGFRSGTLPTPAIVGFGTACELAKNEMSRDDKWVRHLWKRMYNGIVSRIPEVILNGDPEHRYYGNLNMTFSFVEGESLLMALKNVACSSGSACTSASLEPSYVLRSLGLSEDLAHSSLRFGIGRFTTEDEIDLTIDLLEVHVKRLREMSPLWEMFLEGIDPSTIQWGHT